MPDASSVARIEVATERDIQLPGHDVVASIVIHSSGLVHADAVQARLVGRATLEFKDDEGKRFSNEWTVVDETQLLWRYHSLSEMLGVPDEAPDSSRASPAGFAPDARFACRFRLPSTAPTSLSLAGCPAAVKYAIEVRVCRESAVVAFKEHAVVVVQTHAVVRPPPAPNRIVHSKRIPLPGGRSIVIECSLAKAVFKAADEVDAQITIMNRWKESLKFVRFFIITKLECVGRDSSGGVAKKNFAIEHSGVGLPASKPKIASGEGFTFHPRYNVPALNPDAVIPDFLRLSHTLCVIVGRTHSGVLGRLEIPVSLVTEIVDNPAKTSMATPPEEELLIDLSSPPSSWSSATPLYDLLA